MSHNRRFNHEYETIGASRVPKGVGDRYYAQDLARDHRYLQGLAGRMYLNSLGVTSALISGGIVTVGSSVTKVNITAAKGVADFDVEVTKDSDGWAVPATTEINQIPMMIEMIAQTDFSISGATLDGVTTNYIKLRYAEANIQSRVKQFAGGSYYYSKGDSYVLVVDAVAPTTKDVVLASFVGNGTSVLTITQRYPAGPAGHLMTQCALLGMTYDGSDAFQSERVNIATSMPVGASIISSITLTPTAISASRTSANPTGPKYAPFIPRHDADHDISTSQVPQWVIDALNAEKVTFGSVSDFTGTLSSGVITFAAGSDNDKLLDLITEFALVERWYKSSEAANYGSLGGLFTGTGQLALTIAGVNYAITNCSKGSRTITLGTYPANGTVSVALYPGRIAGSTTSTRLRRISGEAFVAAGDVTGEVVVGGRRMGKILVHNHETRDSSSAQRSFYAFFSGGNSNQTKAPAGSGYDNEIIKITEPKTDGANTLVTGKSNDPRTAGVAVYTHLAVVNATNWT